MRSFIEPRETGTSPAPSSPRLLTMRQSESWWRRVCRRHRGDGAHDGAGDCGRSCGAEEERGVARRTRRETRAGQERHQSSCAGRDRPGYLVNLEIRRGRPARIVLGDPMPEMVKLLPAPGELGT